MLSREERIQRLRESLHSKLDSEPVDFRKLEVAFESLSMSSERRFDKLDKPFLAIASITTAAIELGRNARMEVKAITDARELPPLSPDSDFKYSRHGGGSFGEYRRRMEAGEQVLIFVVLERQTVISYALVDLNSSSVGHEVKIIDVELASRRSSGLQTTIQVEGQPFGIGVAHLLVTSLVNYFDARLYTDATQPRSRYVFKSVGFSGYSANNPCLLETRSK